MSASKEVDGFLVSFEAKGEVSAIPVPPKPDYSDDSEANYISEPLTDEEKEVLIKAATYYTNVLSMPGFVEDNLRRVAGLQEAAENMQHYINGTGNIKKYNESDTDSLINSSEIYGTESDEIESVINSDGEEVLGPKKRKKSNSKNILETFLALIKEDFKGKNKQGYLSLNLERVTYVNWFTAKANGNQWYYAIGSFMIAYGAYLHRLSEKKVLLKYRSYIFDRYNWNTGSAVLLPKSISGIAIPKLSPHDKEIFDDLNERLNLISQIGDAPLKERISDNFIGLLSDYGNIDGQKAKAFDVSGASKILGYEYEDD